MIAILTAITGAYAQSNTITGKVTDEESGEAFPGVTVVVKGTTNGTVTDIDGNYKLTVDEDAGTLVFSFVGYRTEEIAIGGRSVIDLEMSPDVQALSEVVVIGYGERERQDVVGAISDVDSEELTKSPSISPDLAMQGRMAGVFVSTPSGNPLERPTVQIRGVNTFGYTDPLYVIDGVPVFEGGAGDPSAGIQDIRSPVNILSLINPNDIESISVLKDAAASAIYGVRAANGVVLITTKKGAKGKPKVDVSAFRGVQNVPNDIDVLTTPQYVALYQEAYANNPATDLDPEFDPASPEYLGNRGTYDWTSPLLNKNAIMEDYSIRISGGNESTKYYTSAGYSKTEGVLKENALERYSLAMNVNSKISKIIETGVTYRLGFSDANNNSSSDLGSMYIAPPWQPVYDPNHPTGLSPVVDLTYEPNPDYNPDQRNPGPSFNLINTDLLHGPATRTNPLGRQATSENTYTILRNLGNAYLQIEPLKGLRIRGNLSGDWYSNEKRSWAEYSGVVFNQTPGNHYAGHDGDAVGRFGRRDSRNWNLQKQLIISYNKAFGDHNFDITLAGEDQYTKWTFRDVSTSQVNYGWEEARNVREGVHPAYRGGFTGFQEYSMQGYMGRLSYKFRDKYYLDATLRRDGSSRFAPENRWETFPGVAVAWRISSEDFMQPVGLISDLKLRASWGTLGNQETTRGFAYLALVEQRVKYAFGADPGGLGTKLFGAAIPGLANEDLSWETVETANIGFDAGFWDNRIRLTAEYYNKTTSDIIQRVNLPANTGIQEQVDLNVASVRNRGIELVLGYTQIFGGLKINASANLTTVDNEVLTLNNGKAFNDQNGNRIEEGYPIGYLRGYKVGGIFQSQEEIDEWSNTYTDNVGSGNPQPGDMYFQDLEGEPEAGQQRNPVPDNVVSPNDRVYLGKTIPGYFYGLNVGATLKGFDLNIFFQGVGDVQKVNRMRQNGEGMGSNGANQWATTLDRWTAEDPSTVMPRAVRQDPNQNGRFSDRWVEDAGFLRLKNVQLGYSLPGNLLSNIGFIERFRIYATGVNLATFTDWTGLDPENDFTPPTRQFLLGFNATF